MALTVRLDDEENTKLDEIVRTLQIADRSTAIRELIDEKWRTLQSDKSFVERRGGHPAHVLNGEPDASERSVRKKALADGLNGKASTRKQST